MSLLIHHILDSLDPAGGGVPMVAVQVAAAQAHRGERVELHAIGHDQDTELNGIHPREDLATKLAVLPGMNQVKVCRHRSRADLRSMLKASQNAGPAWFHLHGVWDPALLTAAKLARQYQIPYCLTPHGMLDPWSLTQSRLKKQLGMLLVHRRMLNRAVFLQALNNDEKRLMKPLSLRSAVEVVPNGVHLPDMSPEQAQMSLADFDSDLQPGRFFLFLARLHYKKGLDILLDAYANVLKSSRLPLDKSDIWPLVIAGPDEGMGDLIGSRMASGNFPGRIVVPGPVYGSLKSALLRTAGAVVLPSRQEGFSLTILEALVNERPAIISDQCHFDEVGTNDAGLVVPVDVKATARAMSDLIHMTDEARQEMGIRGRAMVEGHFTWDRVAEILLELYDSNRGR
ncbi:MAG: glycosyltransferase [Pseudomonadota bacterium]